MTALWMCRNLGWVGSVWKQQLLLPGCVCESLAHLEAEVWDLLALPPCKPKGNELTQLCWNLSRSNQDRWQAGTESWQQNKGTLVSLKFLGSFGQGAGMRSHGRIGMRIAVAEAGGEAWRQAWLGWQLRVSPLSLLAGSSLALFFIIFFFTILGAPSDGLTLPWAEAVRYGTRPGRHWARRLPALSCTGFGTAGSPSHDRVMRGVPS